MWQEFFRINRRQIPTKETMATIKTTTVPETRDSFCTSISHVNSYSRVTKPYIRSAWTSANGVQPISFRILVRECLFVPIPL